MVRMSYASSRRWVATECGGYGSWLAWSELRGLTARAGFVGQALDLEGSEVALDAAEQAG